MEGEEGEGEEGEGEEGGGRRRDVLRIAPVALLCTAGIPNTVVLLPTPTVCTRELAAMQFDVIRGYCV